ncbi:hypothetical protein J4771_11420 [Candidatus Kaistella beijingensis]|uniref:hypothetical protein n=1 Tax=Candidatus Kaistella beijingensis TaxID=2820270 RepID=UPI001CC4462A|nr:hypothetical protein [Candidatus Kaistella beijingensis]UBB89454.1 hypothetical protein J4771_11420 [Candidatus Kaistella beijingensis]
MTETEVFKPIQKKDGNCKMEITDLKKEKTGNRNYVETEKCLLICRNEEAEPKGEVF